MSRRFFSIPAVAILISVAAGLLQCSCLSGGYTGYSVVVANESGAVIRDVSVAFGEKTVFSTGEVGDHEFNVSPSLFVPHPVVVSLRWTSDEGKTQSGILKAAQPVPEDFCGKIHYRILPGPSFAVHVEPDMRSSRSLLPWARPANWEGVPGIPGLSNPE